MILISSSAFAATPVDIWEKKENKSENNKTTEEDQELKIKSPILSKETNKITVSIEEQIAVKGTHELIIFFGSHPSFFMILNDFWHYRNLEASWGKEIIELTVEI